MIVTRDVLLKSCSALQKSLNADQTCLNNIDELVKSTCAQLQQDLQNCMSAAQNYIVNLSNKQQLQPQIQQLYANLQQQTVALQDNLTQISTVNCFREQYKDSLVIYVFGKVKTGKSSLGNYMALGNPDGKLQSLPLKTTNANEAHHSQSQPVYRTLAVNNQTGRLDNVEQYQHFQVGVTETTSTIQSFTLPGLTWVDSPGVHSATFSNEQLAKNYLNHADLILYTESSDSPGRTSDSEEIVSLLAQGCTPVILLTKSDIVTQDLDDNGHAYQVRIPKTPDVRGAQERSVLSNIKKIANAYLDDPVALTNNLARDNVLNLKEKLRVMSLSVSCAANAQNSSEFQSSGMESFLRLLNDSILSEGVKIKRLAPLRQYQNFLTKTRVSFNSFNDQLQHLKVTNKVSADSLSQSVKTYLFDASVLLEKNVFAKFSTLSGQAITFDSQKDAINANFQSKINHTLQDLTAFANQLGAQTLNNIMLEVAPDIDSSLIRFAIPPLSNIPDFVVIEQQIESNADFEKRQKKTGIGALLGAAIGFATGGFIPGLAGAVVGGALVNNGSLDDSPRKAKVGDNFKDILETVNAQLQPAFKNQLLSATLDLLAGHAAVLNSVINQMQSTINTSDFILQKALNQIDEMIENINVPR